MSDDGSPPHPRLPLGPISGGVPRRHRVLTVNGGSSSQKFAVFAAADVVERVLSGRVERIGHGESRLIILEGDRREERSVEAPDQAAAAGLMIERIAANPGLDAIVAVGHRVVHGGGRFVAPELITAPVLDPEHLARKILLIEAVATGLPGVSQVACLALISAPSSPARVRVIPTDEESVIARDAIRLGVASSNEPMSDETTAVTSQGADRWTRR